MRSTKITFIFSQTFFPSLIASLSSALSVYLLSLTFADHYTLALSLQCDQMARLFFNICSFATNKMCPIAYEVCQNRFKISPNIKNPPKYCPRLFNFAKVAKFRQIWSHWTHVGNNRLIDDIRFLITKHERCFVEKRAEQNVVKCFIVDK